MIRQLIKPFFGRETFKKRGIVKFCFIEAFNATKCHENKSAYIFRRVEFTELSNDHVLSILPANAEMIAHSGIVQ